MAGEPFTERDDDIPVSLWRYYRVRHSISGYDAVGEYAAAVETYRSGGEWVSPDGGSRCRKPEPPTPPQGPT